MLENGVREAGNKVGPVCTYTGFTMASRQRFCDMSKELIDMIDMSGHLIVMLFGLAELA